VLYDGDIGDNTSSDSIDDGSDTVAACDRADGKVDEGSSGLMGSVNSSDDDDDEGEFLLAELDMEPDELQKILLARRQQQQQNQQQQWQPQRQNAAMNVQFPSSSSTTIPSDERRSVLEQPPNDGHGHDHVYASPAVLSAVYTWKGAGRMTVLQLQECIGLVTGTGGGDGNGGRCGGHGSCGGSNSRVRGARSTGAGGLQQQQQQQQQSPMFSSSLPFTSCSSSSSLSSSSSPSFSPSSSLLLLVTLNLQHSQLGTAGLTVLCDGILQHACGGGGGGGGGAATTTSDASSTAAATASATAATGSSRGVTMKVITTLPLRVLDLSNCKLGDVTGRV
jgi:hypothetical protein